MKKLNLGCGANKIKGFINIDIEPSVKPDLICNFITQKLPYRKNSIGEVLLYHTIEHINKCYHISVLAEIFRVLKPGGLFYISYPEFLKCVKNWRTNYRGRKAFWEATIFGRGLYLADFHVCIMNTPDFVKLLEDCGFIEIQSKPEPTDTFNTMVCCKKGLAIPNYEDLLQRDMKSVKLQRV